MVTKQAKSTIQIRPMKYDDQRSVYSIEKECFSNPWPEETFLYSISDPAADCWVASIDGMIIGFVIGVETETGYLIANLAVTEIHRKSGIASELLEFILGKAKTRYLESVFLDVRESNFEAIKLYLKYGFRAVGKRKNYYSRPQEDSVVMFKNI
jgi:ribosomal-protein-alanine acetyltransferase